MVFERTTLRFAADLIVVEQMGRLPVLEHTKGGEVIGINTRSDLLAAHAPRLPAALHRARTRIRLGGPSPERRG